MLRLSKKEPPSRQYRLYWPCTLNAKGASSRQSKQGPSVKPNYLLAVFFVLCVVSSLALGACPVGVAVVGRLRRRRLNMKLPKAYDKL